MPSLVENLLYAYQMIHTSSPKQFVFGLVSIKMSYISTGNIIVKGVANHASKVDEFSHFLPYSDLVPSQSPLKREGKFILTKPFSYDYFSIHVLYS